MTDIQGQMFSLVQLDACLLLDRETHECPLFTLCVATRMLMFHIAGLKDKKRRTRDAEGCPRHLPQLSSCLVVTA